MTLSETFIDKILDAGFTETLLKKLGYSYTQKDNWFGVSKYHPEAAFQKGNKEVFISLQGPSGVQYLYRENLLSNHMELADNMALKIIVFLRNGFIEYITATGELPTAEFIEKFITD